MTQIEVQQGSNKDRLDREAARLNDSAYPGQRYVVETIVDASLFAIVLHDGQARANEGGMITRERKRRTFDERDFAALSGTRTHRNQRGLYRTFT